MIQLDAERMIYGFWLSLWYFQTLLSMKLQRKLTNSWNVAVFFIMCEKYSEPEKYIITEFWLDDSWKRAETRKFYDRKVWFLTSIYVFRPSS